ncbi:MAG: DUF3783 domain-containing protein [Oscillospiraceae bacterium]|nr:DUF3783 domain-containing protein [Oscillospiraceae bacterium]
MKAHIRTPFPQKILTYGIESGSEQEQALAALCQAQGILLEEVPADRLGDPLGLLAGGQGFAPAKQPWQGETPSRQALVFCGLDEKRVRQLLGEMGKEGLQAELKAMMTAHNQGWPFGALLGELEKEHLALHRE